MATLRASQEAGAWPPAAPADPLEVVGHGGAGGGFAASASPPSSAGGGGARADAPMGGEGGEDDEEGHGVADGDEDLAAEGGDAPPSTSAGAAGGARADGRAPFEPLAGEGGGVGVDHDDDDDLAGFVAASPSVSAGAAGGAAHEGGGADDAPMDALAGAESGSLDEEAAGENAPPPPSHLHTHNIPSLATTLIGNTIQRRGQRGARARQTKDAQSSSSEGPQVSSLRLLISLDLCHWFIQEDFFTLNPTSPVSLSNSMYSLSYVKKCAFSPRARPQPFPSLRTPRRPERKTKGRKPLPTMLAIMSNLAMSKNLLWRQEQT